MTGDSLGTREQSTHVRGRSTTEAGPGDFGPRGRTDHLPAQQFRGRVDTEHFFEAGVQTPGDTADFQEQACRQQLSDHE
jgi:hypothetical protein